MQEIDLTKQIVRVMQEKDLDAVIAIDAKVLGEERPDYYKRKCALALDEANQVVTSLVAVYDEKVIGFLFGNVYMGEFGIPELTASIDTIGVDPDYQSQGIASEMVDIFLSRMKKALVENVYILVDWDEWGMLQFFEKKGFAPGKGVKLERHLT